MSRIRKTMLEDGTMISTIIRDDTTTLIMDSLLDELLQRKGDAPYETMVFLKEKYPGEEECIRYDTEAEAREGHKEAVERWKEKRGSPVKSDESYKNKPQRPRTRA